MLGQHELDCLARQIAPAVELPAVDHHLRKSQVVRGSTHQARAALEVAFAQRVGGLAV